MWRVAVLALCTTLAGCASTLFNPYPNQIQTVQQQLQAGATDQALTDLEQRAQGDDAVLYRLERARLGQLTGRYADSKADFEQVIARFEGGDLQATVRASSVMRGAASMLTNDNALAYEGEPYERLFVHTFQAFNFLGLNQPDGAAVELRRAAQLQADITEQLTAEIAKAQSEAAENKVPLDKTSGHFAGLDAIAGDVKSSVQNPYLNYLSGVFWEARGDLPRARTDYRQALEMRPGSPLLTQSLDKLGATARDDRKGSVVVLYEEGFAPARDEIKVPVPTFRGEIITIAFPFYHASAAVPFGGLKVAAGNVQADAVPLVSVAALAARSLKEKVPGMMVRQVGRAFAKHELQKQVGDQLGPFGQLAGNLYNLASESADRRSWLMLPAHAGAARLDLPVGLQKLDLSAPGVQTVQEVRVNPRRITLLRLINTRSGLFQQVVEL